MPRKAAPVSRPEAFAVRRLTPTECERLQGFPDGWTARAGDTEFADGIRYRMMGNAVTVNVIEWIAKRILRVGKELGMPPGKPRVVSLFAGVGGFDLGFERAGFEVVACVENEPNCQKVLDERFPNAVKIGDVRKAGKDNLPPCDILCGGFPCQDLSIAGKRGGLSGSRSGLFYEMSRIAHELQPAFVLWENVPGLLSSDQGRDFARVLAEMDRIGYHGCWRVLDSQSLGVAQRRRRVFGCFSRNDIGVERCAQILSLAEGVRGYTAAREKARQGASGNPAEGPGGGGGGGDESGDD